MSQSQQVEHTDSISSQDPNKKQDKKTKSRRPANTAFRQQRLKAWQPILTPKTVLPLFFIIGVIFAPIGGLLLWASSKVQELSIDYTDCTTKAPNVDDLGTPGNPNVRTQSIPDDKWTGIFRKEMTSKPGWARGTANYTWPFSGVVEENVKVCVLEFNIPNTVDPPILFYYRLTNFYQNHRRYVKSLDVSQLKGEARDASQIRAGDCDPLNVGPGDKPYYPCGLIANSMFDDSFTNLTIQNGGDQVGHYDFTQRGIAWSTEKDLYGVSKYKPDQVLPPPNWEKRFPKDGYNTTGLPPLHSMEDFQVWMRTAGLPTFSKLAGRNNNEGLKEFTTYQLRIYDSMYHRMTIVEMLALTPV